MNRYLCSKELREFLLKHFFSNQILKCAHTLSCLIVFDAATDDNDNVDNGDHNGDEDGYHKSQYHF